jgi:two-component system, NtrC family, response regulator
MKQLLIVDDNADIRKQLKWGLGREGYDLLFAEDANQAIAAYRKSQPGVVTLDLGLPPHEDTSEEGFRALQEILRVSPTAKVIVITGNDGKENALRAVDQGAYDFYRKPIDLNELKVIIRRAFRILDLENENRRLLRNMAATDMAGMIGQCPQMENVFTTIRKVCGTDVPVLITGDSGTGKELVARAIHAGSHRREGPFMAINCGAIPENLLESELFGHEKGAFTGAHSRVQGKVEYASKGTLFLDEIGELPAQLQVKLLRFLQEKVIQRVGGREDIPVDVRILAATNIDIAGAIDEGTFREDLYYRLGVVTVTLPQLKERGGDILLLANYFLRKHSEDLSRKVTGFSPAAAEHIKTYPWPGNVRELENKIQRAIIMASAAMLEPEDLGFIPVQATEPETYEHLTLREARSAVERNLLQGAIDRSGGNIAKAAESLGVSRPTMYDLLRKHGLSAGGA